MYLGIDLGTGSVKALLVDDAGKTVGEASRTYPVNSPHPGFAETDPTMWWQQTVASVREACQNHKNQIRGIGLSGQAHGLVALDGADEVLRPAILWADQRASAEMEQVLALPEHIRLPLANPVVSGMAGLSLIWLRHHEAACYEKIRRILSPKDWLRLAMTGDIATEPTDASMTLLYDVKADQWADDFMDAVGLDRRILAPIVESTSIAGRLTANAANELGLPAAIPVAAGMADSAACLLGMGQIKPGATILQVGSGIQIITLVEDIVPTIQPFYSSYRAVERSLYLMAALQNGGTVFEWARSVLDASWEEMYSSAFDDNKGNGGVIFLPYATGERAPLLDPNATASWNYMRLGCTRQHMIRAIFEGVALAVRDSWDALLGIGVQADHMLLAGGGSVDARWQQLLADIVQVPLKPAHHLGNASLGAAYLGGMVAGHWQSLGDLPISPVETTPIMPRPYEEPNAVLQRFRATYRGLKQAQTTS